MLDFITSILQFALQSAVVVVCALVIIGFLFSLTQKNKESSGLKIRTLNDVFDRYQTALGKTTAHKKDLKKTTKALKKDQGSRKDKPKVFVINFEGDIKASAAEQLREEVTAILTCATHHDRVIAKIESPGGVVHGYGFAASQLQRITDSNIPLDACVDKVAASGGYMMASVADKIYGAPFAILGSIGVVASLPNFNALLEKNHVKYLEVTAGEYKRTVTTLGKVTDQGLDKFKEQIEGIHTLFKDHVTKNRPSMDIQKVATGEYWFGTQALELGLLDEIKTSDALLCELSKSHLILEVTYKGKQSFKEKLSEGLGSVSETLLNKGLTRLKTPPFMS